MKSRLLRAYQVRTAVSMEGGLVLRLHLLANDNGTLFDTQHV